MLTDSITIEIADDEYIATSIKRRTHATIIDVVLFVVTFMLGYMIWAALIYRKGLTPGKQLLRLRVVEQSDFTHAKWWRMFLRDAMFKLSPLFLFQAVVILGTSEKFAETTTILAYLAIYFTVYAPISLAGVFAYTVAYIFPVLWFWSRTRISWSQIWSIKDVKEEPLWGQISNTMVLEKKNWDHGIH